MDFYRDMIDRSIGIDVSLLGNEMIRLVGICEKRKRMKNKKMAVIEWMSEPLIKKKKKKKETRSTPRTYSILNVGTFFQGERLSHAVGCAFAACLERKQRRDKECGVTMTFDSKTSTFTRSGSFRQPSLTERLQDTRERAVGPSYPI